MSNFYTLMNCAAKLGRVDVMDVLYTKYNIPLDGKDAAGCTVLGHAIYRGHLHVVQWLLRKPELSLEANASKYKLIEQESALEFARHCGATEIADCISAEVAARARWSSSRAAWLAVCVCVHANEYANAMYYNNKNAHKKQYMSGIWQPVIDGDSAVPVVAQWIADGNDVNATTTRLFDYSLAGGVYVTAPPVALMFTGLERGMERHAADVAAFTNDRVQALHLLLRHGAYANIMVSYILRHETITMNVVMFACQRLPSDTLVALLAALLSHVPPRFLKPDEMTIKDRDGWTQTELESPLTLYCGEKEYGVYIPENVYHWDLGPGIRLLVRYGADWEFSLQGDRLCPYWKGRIVEVLDAAVMDAATDAAMDDATAAMGSLGF
jgi:hypothetical protein